jgi:hypothetical protein
MDIRRLTPFAFLLGLGLCAGCLHAPKPEEPAKTEPTTAALPQDPNDPLPGGLSPKFIAFLTSNGLTATPAKPGEAARLTVGWKHSIAFAPDPVHGGEPIPGLVARVWLFGPDDGSASSDGDSRREGVSDKPGYHGNPLNPDGELLAGVWDLSPKATGGAPKLLELWHIDREAAKKFCRKDSIGDGYTLFLPWSTYNVDLKQVNVMLRFNSADGRSLASAPQTLTLDHSATLQRAADKLGISGRDTSVDFSKVSAALGSNAAPK